MKNHLARMPENAGNHLMQNAQEILKRKRNKMDKLYEREIKEITERRVAHLLAVHLKQLKMSVTISGRRVAVEDFSVTGDSINIELRSPVCFPDTHETVIVMKTDKGRKYEHRK